MNVGGQFVYSSLLHSAELVFQMISRCVICSNRKIMTTEKSSTVIQGSSYSIVVAVMGRMSSCLGHMQELSQVQCDGECIQYNS